MGKEREEIDERRQSELILEKKSSFHLDDYKIQKVTKQSFHTRAGTAPLARGDLPMTPFPQFIFSPSYHIFSNLGTFFNGPPYFQLSLIYKSSDTIYTGESFCWLRFLFMIN